MGTSTWAYPGWTGEVWDAERPTRVLSREGLPAYAAHPLFRTVGIDRAWHAPLETETWRHYAEQVPNGFDFVVKAPAAALQQRDRKGVANPHFLDAAWLTDVFVGPLVDGAGDRVGPIVLQFSPQDLSRLGGAEGFAQRLHAFLDALPTGPLYAVEVRERSWLTRAYAQALAAVGATHVITVVPGMPAVPTQARIAAATGSRARVARWMLHPDWRYEAARDTWKPFHRLGAPHPVVRDDLARFVVDAAAEDRPTWITVGNKAEGSAPLSIVGLATAVAVKTVSR
jgi:uncharacterized protein YecE (DUF72 family)